MSSDQVVDDGEGQQERAQRRRQVGPDDRQHREGERDVRGSRYGPALRVAAVRVDGQVQQRRYGDPAGRRRDGYGRIGRSTQRADHQLALELQASDEEEQRQRAVGRPVLDV
jgi:hypothetical protein